MSVMRSVAIIIAVAFGAVSWLPAFIIGKLSSNTRHHPFQHRHTNRRTAPPRNHRENQRAGLLGDAKEFANSKRLFASFECSKLAAPLEVVADAFRRNITCRCTIQAPQDAAVSIAH
jgi:hypothetical protein